MWRIQKVFWSAEPTVTYTLFPKPGVFFTPPPPPPSPRQAPQILGYLSPLLGVYPKPSAHPSENLKKPVRNYMTLYCRWDFAERGGGWIPGLLIIVDLIPVESLREFRHSLGGPTETVSRDRATPSIRIRGIPPKNAPLVRYTSATRGRHSYKWIIMNNWWRRRWKFGSLLCEIVFTKANLMRECSKFSRAAPTAVMVSNMNT